MHVLKNTNIISLYGCYFIHELFPSSILSHFFLFLFLSCSFICFLKYLLDTVSTYISYRLAFLLQDHYCGIAVCCFRFYHYFLLDFELASYLIARSLVCPTDLLFYFYFDIAAARINIRLYVFCLFVCLFYFCIWYNCLLIYLLRSVIIVSCIVQIRRERQSNIITIYTSLHY